MGKQTERWKHLKEEGADCMEKRRAERDGSGKERSEKTVRGRIFISNAWMILTTLLAIALVNVGIFKLYWETIEHDWEASIRRVSDTQDIEALIKQWTLHQHSFYLLVFADLVICCVLMILIAGLFTRNLAGHMMKPLGELEKAAIRVRNHDLTEEISYQGEVEFESIAGTFNAMQSHLRQEQEKNQKYEKARTEMIAGISHDLRTPLTAIRGTIKALLDGVVKDPEMQTKFLKTAYKRTGDMSLLLNQLFELSKIETGDMPLNLQSVDPERFITDYVKGKQESENADSNSSNDSNDSKQIEIYAEVGANEEKTEKQTEKQTEKSLNPPEKENREFYKQENSDGKEMSGVTGYAYEITADPEQLQRIFDNLVENSRKYSGADPLQIKITGKMEKSGYMIRFSDNGKGVPEENLSKIFEEFYREDGSRNQKEGNGLGLYIVKCLIESMGGQVWAENQNGLTICMKLKGEAQDGSSETDSHRGR